MARLVFFFIPALTFVLGIPLALKRIPPNRYYGFRTPKAFSSGEAWYAINYALGLALMVAGAVGALAVLMLSLGIVALEPDVRYFVGIIFNAVVAMLCLLPVASYSRRF